MGLPGAWPVTFHSSRDASALFSRVNNTSCCRARAGTVPFLHEEPCQPPGLFRGHSSLVPKHPLVTQPYYSTSYKPLIPVPLSCLPHPLAWTTILQWPANWSCGTCILCQSVLYMLLNVSSSLSPNPNHLAFSVPKRLLSTAKALKTTQEFPCACNSPFSLTTLSPIPLLGSFGS